MMNDDMYAAKQVSSRIGWSGQTNVRAEAPGLMEHIASAHKDLSILQDKLNGLLERLGPVLGPDGPIPEPGYGGSPMALTAEPSAAVDELRRLRNLIVIMSEGVDMVHRRLQV